MMKTGGPMIETHPSDTPRTDAAMAMAAIPFEAQESILMDMVVPADFARQLERERNAAFAMSKCECGTDEACANLAKLHAELAEARKDAERYKGAYEAAIAFVDSHAADPDITPKMCETYAALEVHRAAIENTSSPKGKG